MFYGLDVHKKTIQVAVIEGPSEEARRSFSISADPASILNLAYSLSPSDKVALESTTHAFPIANLLRKNGASVMVSNPMKTKIIAESKIKTDKVDALTLANLLASGYLPWVWEPDEKTAELRKVTSYVNALTKQKTMVKNRIHSILHRNLISYSQFSDLFGKKGREFLATLLLPVEEKIQLDLELGLLDYFEGLLARNKERLSRKAMKDEDTLRLMTIPGIDFIIAISLKAAIGEIERFKESKKLVSYLGLNPRVSQTGETCYTGPITKRGRSHARWVLIQAAQHAVNAPSPLRAFFLRIKGKKGRNKAIVAVASKLTRIIWHMLTKGEDYFYSPPLRTREKLSKLRIIATGIKLRSGLKKGEASKGGRAAYITQRMNDHNNGKLAEVEYRKFVSVRLGSSKEDEPK